MNSSKSRAGIARGDTDAGAAPEERLRRRDVLKALGAAAAVAPVGAMAQAAPVSPPEEWHDEADVIVVGMGGAGASAALEATTAGASVIVLEKGAEPGGATRFSGGVVYAAETTIQKAAGLSDTKDDMYKFLMNVGGKSVVPELVRAYVDNATHTVERLIELGVEFPPEQLYQSGLEHMEEYATTLPAPIRGHSPVGAGYGVFTTLRMAAEEKGARVMLETPAIEILPNEDGVVGGVKAKTKDGREINIRAHKAVIVTSGDFNRSPEKRRAFSNMAIAAEPIGPLNHTGDGLTMAQAWGADLMGTYAIAGIPAPEGKPVMFTFYLPKYPTAGNAANVAVNSRGKRFFNETVGYPIANREVFYQPGNFAWTVFDERARTSEMGVLFPGFTDPTQTWSRDLAKEEAQGLVFKADTFGELAQKMGVDAEVFETTMRDYNTHAKNGKDPEFGKTEKLGTVDTAPFYAIKTRPGMLINAGGLRIDTQARVMDTYGNPIPRLYAAGMSVTGGFSGDIVAASGYSVGLGITFGRIAALNAVTETSL
ncbi:MAG: FAD-dependent oxidoreductase [Pseudomonadota bacterium]|nr:FAD-dependent oxidoreductase [Pseudomonadota bacterium]